MRVIKELTPEQEKDLPIFREEYLRKALDPKRIDRENLDNALADAYSIFDKSKPEIVILRSPREALYAKRLYKELCDILGTDLTIDMFYEELEKRRKDGSLQKKKTPYEYNHMWGAQDMYWIAWAKFTQKIGVLLNNEMSFKLDVMEQIACESDWWWPCEVKNLEDPLDIHSICFVSQKPIKIHWDEERRLHNENGAAVEYEDGFNIYSWHGQRIPREWMEKKDALTPTIALTHPNMELRRCACEILGWAKVLEDPSLDKKVIDKDSNPEIGELISVNIPDAGRRNFLYVRCGTGRNFALCVPNDMQTARQANAWTNHFDNVEDFNPEVRT